MDLMIGIFYILWFIALFAVQTWIFNDYYQREFDKANEKRRAEAIAKGEDTYFHLVYGKGYIPNQPV